MDKQNNEKSFLKNTGTYFKEYCKLTGIHGFQYFGENRSYFERIWWLIIFWITLSSCIYAIMEVYQKWDESPVIVTLATQETPIYSIPFPAVTICPELKTNSEIYSHSKVVQNMEKLTTNERELMEYMSLVCDKYPYYPNIFKKKFLGQEFYKILNDTNSKFPFESCRFMDETISCEDSFIPIITDEGICYTFNILDRSKIYRNRVVQNSNYHRINHLSDDWSIEKGYTSTAKLDTYPRRALLSGYSNSLAITLVAHKLDYDAFCKSGLQGYRVLLHIPSRIPSLTQHHFKVPENEIVVASITPDMIKTSSAVSNYDVETRNCYFTYEKPLKYFKIYTSNNCKIECLTNFTLYYCGCVRFDMPRRNTTSICSMRNSACLRFAANKMVLLNLPDFDQHPNITKKKRHGNVTECNCLPLCSDLSYNIETSQNKWDWHSSYLSISGNKSVNPWHLVRSKSKLIIFFKTSQFIFSERNALYGPLDFLANFGGLLGLFTGFSLLSLMEIIYFLSLRMFCNCRLYGYWAGKDN